MNPEHGTSMSTCAGETEHEWRLIREDEVWRQGVRVWVRRWYCTRCRLVEAFTDRSKAMTEEA